MKWGLTQAEVEELRRKTPVGELTGTAKLMARQVSGMLGKLPYDPEWREAQVFEPTAEDGHEATLHLARLPAMFWRVTCDPLDIDMTTGSGVEAGQVASAMCAMIADGCLSPTEHEEGT
jgi:hypothetical protein